MRWRASDVPLQIVDRKRQQERANQIRLGNGYYRQNNTYKGDAIERTRN